MSINKLIGRLKKRNQLSDDGPIFDRGKENKIIINCFLTHLIHDDVIKILVFMSYEHSLAAMESFAFIGFFC